MKDTRSMQVNLRNAISAIEKSIREAQRYCDKYHYEGRHDGDFETFEHYVQRSFVELLVLTDCLGLKATYDLVHQSFLEAKSTGFGATESYEGEPYSKWSFHVRMLADSVASSYGVDKTVQSEITDLKALLKRAVYTICDTLLFPKAPSNESDVHRRLEGILKCYYPDLKSKPSMTKPIKNFEPDTGLPSAKTLLEYKFISNDADAKRVAEEILTDASGYRSRDWASLLFVIYETKRVKSEEEWQNLLRACELVEGFDAVVLSGETRVQPKLSG